MTLDQAILLAYTGYLPDAEIERLRELAAKQTKAKIVERLKSTTNEDGGSK